MKKILIMAFMLLVAAGGQARAVDFAANNRGLFGDIDGYLVLTREDNQSHVEPTQYISEFSIYRNLKVGKMTLTPYYYFKNQTYNSDIFTDFTITENMLGVDFVIHSTSLEAVTFGLGGKYRSESGGDSEGLLVTKFRFDF